MTPKRRHFISSWNTRPPAASLVDDHFATRPEVFSGPEIDDVV